MRTLISRATGVVVGAVLSLLAGGVSAQDLFKPDPVSLQFERDVRSTYLVQFNSDLSPSEIKGRANAIVARFGGRIKHTYEHVFPGFAIQMNSVAMANLLKADDLGIVRISRDGIVSIAAKGDKGPPPGKGGGGGDTTPTCGETLGWNIKRVTPMEQVKTTDSEGNILTCSVNVSANNSETPDYSESGIKVCVIDTGIAEHPDLNNKYFDTPYNFTNDKDSDDNNGHGTHVAGIIGAIANNDIGVVGVAPKVPVYPIKVLNRRGSGSFSGVIAGIDFAVTKGCTIANMSLGAATSDTSIDKAVKCASGVEAYGDGSCSGKDVIFTIAAGNSTIEIDGYSPARAGDGSNTIFTIASFGDTDGADDWSYFSNYSGEVLEVDFALPGEDVLSTVKDGEYKSYNGTSMAAPHMAGLLVRYLDGGGSYVNVGNSILSSSVQVVRDDVYGNKLEDWYDIIIDK